MRKTALVMICIVVGALAGCGNFEWFPSSSGGGGTTPSPPPPGQTITDVQADTLITTFYPYPVAFGTISSSTTTASISVSGDTGSMYTINGGTAVSTAGTVKKGDSVVVQHTSSNSGTNQTISTLLNIGGASAYYRSITGSFIFLTKKNVPLNSTYPSDIVPVPSTLPGSFVFPATLSLASSTTALGSTMWVNNYQVAPGAPLLAGQTLQLKHTTAATATTTVMTAVTLTPTSGTPYTVTFKTVTQ